MADLSPQAQAVMIAARPHLLQSREEVIAAVLRAAANQVVPREPAKDSLWASDAYRQRADTRAYLLAIAIELEAHR